MKIFIGLTEIAGYYNNLKKGFDELGVECTFITLHNHPLKYDEDQTSNVLVSLAKYTTKKRVQTPKFKLLQKVWWVVLQQISKTLLFVWVLVKHDVFIFGYSSSFLSFYDLPILNLLHKKIIYVFHGSDSRSPYLDGFVNRNIEFQDIVKVTRKRKAQIKKIERYADIIIDNPLSSHFHEKSVIVVQIIGIPFKCDKDYRIKAEFRHSRGIRILHSSSDLEGKGTLRIREIIKNLQAKSYPLEFIEIIGKSNAVVLNELAHCDFVIDQLYSDTPMASFATEAAYFGKPAIVGGYGQAEIRRIFPAEKIPPVFFCHPDEMEKAIEKLIVDEIYRKELGRKVKQFVETNWTPKKVAKRYLQLIRGNIPEDWLYDPKDISYLHGCGLPEYRSKELIKSVIEKGGKKALQLSDKPDLEHMFMEFARCDKS
jgi:hypothetical protein